VPPCRLVDTRQAGGAIPAGGARSFLVAGPLTDQGGAASCGVPFGQVRAVYISVVAVRPTSSGFLTVHPYPTPAPVASDVNFDVGQTIASSILAPICNPSTTSCAFDLTVTMGLASSNVVIDITGYLGPKP
jgi:hypothetical protein